MNADGSNQTRLTFDPASDNFPTWSPDGRHIAFSTNRNADFEIFVMRANGTNLINQTDNDVFDSNPNWSNFIRP